MYFKDSFVYCSFYISTTKNVRKGVLMALNINNLERKNKTKTNVYIFAEYNTRVLHV